jgi:curli biogenesis system outer membrane secretion channel CsgG
LGEKVKVIILRLLMALFFTWSVFSSCAPTAEVFGPAGPTMEQAISAPATGGKMRIAVMEFSNRTRYDVGTGMRSMLTSTLFRTNRFIVVEREMLTDVLIEQQLGSTGVISSDTAAPIGEVEGAQFLIYGDITDFEPGQRGVKTIVGGVQQSHLSIDMKIVDARTARVVAATSVEGKATDVSLSSSALNYVGQSPLYYLEAWNNTPMGSAIRLCIDRSVDYIVNHIK